MSLTLYVELDTGQRHCCGTWHTLENWVAHLESHEGGTR